MSATIILSLAIRLAALAWVIRLLASARHWYIVFFGGMIALMVLRQALTLGKSPVPWPINFTGNLDELPGLAVSILAFLGLIAVDRLVRLERDRSLNLKKEIGEHERTALALKESEERFSLAMRGANDGLWDWNLKIDEVYYSPRWCSMLGYEMDELPGTFETWAKLVDPADKDRVQQLVEDYVSEISDSFETEFRMRHKDGSWVTILSRAFLVREEGDAVRLVGTHVDISERQHAEAALRQAEDILHEGIEALPVGFAVYDADDRLMICNETYRGTFSRHGHLLKPGIRFEDLLRPSAHLVGPQVGIQDPEEYLRLRILSTRRAEHPWLYQQTTGRWIETCDRPTRRGGFISVRTDITEDRQRQEQLRQAQKLEAVGQLTGGVAHDFNNLLMVIMGNVQLLERQLGGKSKPLDAVLQATRRGAELTQRLLAFSRQQPLRPQAVDLGRLASGMSELLTRTLGETIEVRTAAEDGLWEAVADPGQVENALLNLAINARDAMPSGGKLTIECANARLEDASAAQDSEAVAGDYVILAVSDNGFGMSAEVRDKAFEPFFTTKEVGEGSGLGLSMVYGFAKQSGGYASIYSEEGFGTTVKLYLPRAELAVKREVKDAPRAVPQGADETILVIEDNPDVRDVAVMMLEELGYRIIAVGDAAAAAEALSGERAVDLVLSDVVLPGGTSGPEFAEQVRERNPDLKFMFMSGYPAETSQHNGLLGSGEVLLNKPFERRQLAEALRKALD